MKDKQDSAILIESSPFHPLSLCSVGVSFVGSARHRSLEAKAKRKGKGKRAHALWQRALSQSHLLPLYRRGMIGEPLG